MDAIADYEWVDKQLDLIIKSGEKYFNSLNFDRNSLTFIENENGRAIRHGKNGFWAIPKLSALSNGDIIDETTDEADWITIGDFVETPFIGSNSTTTAVWQVFSIRKTTENGLTASLISLRSTKITRCV